jgi:tetratricopeptide (TPR) repeat protein
MNSLRALTLLLTTTTMIGCAAPYDKGLAAFEQGKWKESIEYFEAVKGWDDNSEEAEAMIAKACFMIGKEALKAANWEEALQFLPRSKGDDYAQAKELVGKAYVGRGKEAFGQERWDAAVNDLLLVRPECSQYSQARELMAEAKERRGS